MSIGDDLRDMVFKRTGLREDELYCPREKSDMTPCVARDGDCAMTNDFYCVGCGVSVQELIEEEIAKGGEDEV